MNLFNRAKRCYRQLEDRLDYEDEPCRIALLWLMARIAKGQGWKPLEEDVANDEVCNLMFAACKEAWRREKAGPDLCLELMFWCETKRIMLDVLEPDTPRARIAVNVDGEKAECNLPPACRRLR